MDHNEHMYGSALGKALSDKESLNLGKIILKHTRPQTGATFFQCSKPIDGLWASSNLDISNACVMPFGYRIGDHHAFVLNIPLESLVGKNLAKIVHPASHRLDSWLPGCGKEYVRSLAISFGIAYWSIYTMHTWVITLQRKGHRR